MQDETFTVYRKGTTVKVFDGNGIQLSPFHARCILDGLGFLLEE